jgi:hypothetical protein
MSDLQAQIVMLREGYLPATLFDIPDEIYIPWVDAIRAMKELKQRKAVCSE